MRKSIIILCFLSILLGALQISYHFVTPKIVERRARDLGLMQYNSEKDKFVAKDSVVIDVWDLHYLQHGTMKGY